ncbi:MAG: adenine-specific methyltransferase EcoRI family protein [Synergistaceae bacterium]|nr:adenine-specific methyltransferase EcoRI family protein [Synergistaceae bacterium]
MAKNTALHKAMKAKQDEFYTDLNDISNELFHYRDYFRGKTILCNCDDPFESNFFQYFALWFNVYGLKKLIATSYVQSPVAQLELPLFEEAKPEKERTPYCAIMTEFKDFNGDGAEDLADVEWALKNNGIVHKLKGDGDFRSPECIEFLKEADIVVTNPPFSLFREYVAQLIEYDKKFIIIGNKNAVTYKEIFPLIMQNKMWFGVGFNGGNAYFKVPTDDPSRYANGVYNPEEERVKFRNVTWYTNLQHHRRNEKMTLWRRYYDDPSMYPKYDNYDAIEVSKTSDIPCDYYEAMGVPITFLDKYNPEQFHILGLDRYIPDNPKPGRRFTINGKEIYARILIRRKK